jgi:hypothetical protein
MTNHSFRSAVAFLIEWRPDHPIDDEEYDRNYDPPHHEHVDHGANFDLDPVDKHELHDLHFDAVAHNLLIDPPAQAPNALGQGANEDDAHHRNPWIFDHEHPAIIAVDNNNKHDDNKHEGATNEGAPNTMTLPTKERPNTMTNTNTKALTTKERTNMMTNMITNMMTNMRSIITLETIPTLTTNLTTTLMQTRLRNQADTT